MIINMWNEMLDDEYVETTYYMIICRCVDVSLIMQMWRYVEDM